MKPQWIPWKNTVRGGWYCYSKHHPRSPYPFRWENNYASEGAAQVICDLFNADENNIPSMTDDEMRVRGMK